jgi:hypothetical protein
MECQYCQEKIKGVIEYNTRLLKALKVSIKERIDEIEDGVFV